MRGPVAVQTTRGGGDTKLSSVLFDLQTSLTGLDGAEFAL